jgi:hypothetical protein
MTTHEMTVPEPDWVPLERLFSEEVCGYFMFMGIVGEIRLYKHSVTRRYINLTPDGRAWAYDGPGYHAITIPEAVRHLTPPSATA